MQPPDDMQRMKDDILEEDTAMIEPETGVLERDTGVIERLSRQASSREAHGSRRQQLLQQKQSYTPQSLHGNASANKALLRQLTLLREENQQLRQEVEALRARGNVTTPSPASFNGDANAEIEAIHRGYQQELQQYQQHLADLMEERNRQQEEYHNLELRYQDLYYNFLASVEEEAHRMVTEAARTVTLSPTGGETHPLLQDVVQTLQTHAQQLEEEHAAHTIYIMREAQRKAARLEEELRRERQQLMEERQNLLALQQSVREQAEQRYQAIQTRLQVRWLLRLVSWVGGMLAVLLVVQVLALYTLQVPISFPLFFSIVAPVLAYPIVACLVVYLRERFHFVYESAPHKKKTRKLSEHHA
ncbi:MAG TPA: hypothetical protein VKV40_07040 [Ktedonobacteraceae bacterium]|nr:hypothetical protein [Ktedonobacteraceae bacterium]